VIDDVEEADVAAGRADPGRDVRERAIVAVGPGREIDDGKDFVMIGSLVAPLSL
jgi:hypothetical protein